MTTYLRRFGAALALLMALAPAAFGQEAGPKAARKIHTRSTVFRLPVQLDERERADLKELKLFVKSVPGDWTCAETVAPTQNAFSFRAPHDGEYWFAFVTVDKAGRMTPPGPEQEPPGLIVVVDTVAPDVEVCPLPGSSQVYLQCKLHDANPDYRSVKIEYETEAKGGSTWVALEQVADTPGVFHVPDKGVLGGKVRVHAADKAGNAVDRVIELGSWKSLAPAPAGLSITSAPLASATDLTALPSSPTLPIPDARPTLPVAPTTTAKPPAPLPGDLTGSPVPSLTEVVPASVGTPAPEATPPASQVQPRDIPVVNSLHCKIDFSIEQLPGEVAKVEVWGTPDGGKTWQVYGESRDGRGPAQVEFPRDGVYGYVFVVKTGAGPAASPPVAGDGPDGWIEVDTIKPVAELLAATVGTGPDAGHLLISWVAQDRNFGPEPIGLFYAVQPIGPWYPIAEKLPNSGAYRWPIPKGLANRVLVRVQATDRAGNVALCDSPSPVQLDGGRPRVKVLSVAPVSKE